MMTVKEAFLKARKEFTDTPLRACVDIGDRFAFYFAEDEGIPGNPYITINKTSGEVGWLGSPPIENFRLLQKGKKIPIDTIEQ